MTKYRVTMTGQHTKWLLVSLFVLWIFFTLGTFFAVQKPFGAANALAIGRVLLDLLVASWLMLIGLGLGVWLLQRFFPLDLSLIELLAFGEGLGLGVIGLLIFGLGLLGLFQWPVAYGVTLGLSVVLVPQLRRLLKQLRSWRPTNLPNRLVTIYLSLIGLFALFLALLPPTGFDGLFYHLTSPRLYLQAGRIVGGFNVPHFSFPSLMEMLFAWAMLLRGDIAAKLLHAAFGLLLTGLVYLVTRHLLGKKAAWPAVLILTSMPMLGTLAGWAYNDLALAFYQLASLYAVIRWRGERRVGRRKKGEEREEAQLQTPNSKLQNGYWLILSGLLAGLAMGLKYTSFVTPVVISGLILWNPNRISGSTHDASRIMHHVSRISRLVNPSIFALSALIIALPWYIKNWFFTGNPVYPFLFDLFGGQYWDSFRAGWYAVASTGIGWQPTTLLALPWLLTLGVRDTNFWDGRTGPLLLLFLPLLLYYTLFHNIPSTTHLQNPKSKIQNQGGSLPAGLNPLLIYALAHFGFWTLGVIWSRALWQSRLLLPGLAGLIPVAGWVWVKLPDLDLSHFSLSRFVNIAVGLVLVLTLVDVGLLTRKINPVPYLVGLETREEHLLRRLGAHYAAMQQINDVLPSTANIVFLWEPRSYYCQRDCRPDSILDEFPHLTYQHGSAEAIMQTWRKAGVSHVLVNRTGLDFMLGERSDTIDTAILGTLESQYMRQVFDVVGAYQIYALEQ
jgi:hypothetical protein